jgi:5,5'-dehydrodivanillate O-demethylase
MKQEEQDALTRVGPGTPMGELLRRYWLPVAASSEIAAGGTRAVRLLGEDLVLFRSPDGALGLLEERCPHRGTRLRYGSVSDAGLRCPYHGFLFDRGGACLEIPGESEWEAASDHAALRERMAARAYRAEELGGLVWAYLGPEPAPLLPRWDLFVWDGVLRDIGRALIDCNWLQIMENSVDPLHLEWLHGHQLRATISRAGPGRAPGGTSARPPAHYGKRHVRIGFDRFPYGIIKRRILAGGSEEDDDWKIGHPLVFPVMLRVGADVQHRFQIRVPVDDTHTLHFWYSCYKPPAGTVVRQDAIPVYDVPWRDERGEFIVDFIDGQDIMAWVSQGPIADRSRETLVSADRGITLYRRMLLEQIERVRAGHDPLGAIRHPEDNRIIELPQERNKYRGGAAFLAESVELGHARYSPIKDQIRALLLARAE